MPFENLWISLAEAQKGFDPLKSFVVPLSRPVTVPSRRGRRSPRRDVPGGPEEGEINSNKERGDLWGSEQKGFGLRWAQVPNQNVIT